jgi:hypothetical protein
MADGAPRVKLAIQMFEPFSAVFREHRENSAVGKKNSILLLFFECFLFFLVGGFTMAARGDLIFFSSSSLYLVKLAIDMARTQERKLFFA